MRKPNYAYVLFVTCLVAMIDSVDAKMRPDAVISITNLVDVLPHISTFAKKIDLDLSEPLATNRVTEFSGYHPARGYGRESVGVEIDRRFHFTVDVENILVDTFADRKYSMTILWRAEDIKPLIQPSKITKEQALEMAHKYLERLGYSEKDMPVLPPTINQWTWEPPGALKPELLPFFTVEWPWTKYHDWKYFRMDIDGFRQKITNFSTIYPRQDPPAKQ